MGDNKYWDYLECCWVRYEADRDEMLVPTQLGPESAEDATDVTAVESSLQ